MSDQGADGSTRADGVDGGVGEGGSARRYLAGAAATVTLFVAVAGYVVAANNAVSSITVFGVVTLPGTPVGVALYGAALSVVLVGVLFGLVRIASRYDDAERA